MRHLSLDTGTLLYRSFLYFPCSFDLSLPRPFSAGFPGFVGGSAYCSTLTLTAYYEAVNATGIKRNKY